MLTVNKKREENIKQIPTQYNFNIKLNNRLNRMAINTLVNRVLIIGLIISNIILFNKVNEVKVQPVLLSTETPQASYNIPNLPPIEEVKNLEVFK